MGNYTHLFLKAEIGVSHRCSSLKSLPSSRGGKSRGQKVKVLPYFYSTHELTQQKLWC